MSPYISIRIDSTMTSGGIHVMRIDSAQKIRFIFLLRISWYLSIHLLANHDSNRFGKYQRYFRYIDRIDFKKKTICTLTCGSKPLCHTGRSSQIARGFVPHACIRGKHIIVLETETCTTIHRDDPDMYPEPVWRVEHGRTWLGDENQNSTTHGSPKRLLSPLLILPNRA